MFTAHVDTKENFTVEAEATLKASEASGQSKVSKDVVLGCVKTVQRLVTQSTFVHVTHQLQFIVRIQILNTFFFD